MPVAATEGIGIDELRARDRRARSSAAAAPRIEPTAAVDRPGLRGEGQRHGGDRHAGRRRAVDRRRPCTSPRAITRRASARSKRRGRPSSGSVRATGWRSTSAASTTTSCPAVTRSSNPDRWHLTDRLDASLDVLATLDHDVSRRGAYVAYIGAGEHPVKMRVLGTEALAPGTTGAVRLFLPAALPLLPGDRFILRESGRDETVGGGEILDIAPVLRASRAAPDRSIERVVRERGWVRVDELERLTGEAVRADARRLGDDPRGARGDRRRRRGARRPRRATPVSTSLRSTSASGRRSSRATTSSSRPASCSRPMPSTRTSTTRSSPNCSTAGSPHRRRRRRSQRHPGAGPSGSHRRSATGSCSTRRRSTRRRGSPPSCSAATPEGFTVAAFRDATGASRKFVLPLVSELDSRGDHPAARRRAHRRAAPPDVDRRSMRRSRSSAERRGVGLGGSSVDVGCSSAIDVGVGARRRCLRVSR